MLGGDGGVRGRGRLVAWSPSVPSFDSASSRWRSASLSRPAIVAIPSSGGEAIASDSSTRAVT